MKDEDEEEGQSQVGRVDTMESWETWQEGGQQAVDRTDLNKGSNYGQVQAVKLGTSPGNVMLKKLCFRKHMVLFVYS